MRKLELFLVLLLVVIAVPAFAACKTCNPGCKDATTGITGWTQCASTSGGCDLWGTTCTGTGSGTGNGGECGTPENPDPCDQGLLVTPTLSPYELRKVHITTAPGYEWRLMATSVSPASATVALQ